MVFVAKPRRSIWINGLETEEPTPAQRQEQAQRLAERIGAAVDLPPIPSVDGLQMRPPRITPPESLAEFCFTDPYERALHSKGDRLEEIRGIFANPPDIVAHPRSESELEAVLSWCSDHSYVAIPYGGGS